jgi:hypothetical protein
MGKKSRFHAALVKKSVVVVVADVDDGGQGLAPAQFRKMLAQEVAAQETEGVARDIREYCCSCCLVPACVVDPPFTPVEGRWVGEVVGQLCPSRRSCPAINPRTEGGGVVGAR